MARGQDRRLGYTLPLVPAARSKQGLPLCQLFSGHLAHEIDKTWGLMKRHKDVGLAKLGVHVTRRTTLVGHISLPIRFITDVNNVKGYETTTTSATTAIGVVVVATASPGPDFFTIPSSSSDELIQARLKNRL